MKTINAITAFKRRVREAYKQKDRKSRAAKLRVLGDHIEKAQRQDPSLTRSQISTAGIAIKAQPRIIAIDTGHPQLHETVGQGSNNDAVGPFGADQEFRRESMCPEQVESCGGSLEQDICSSEIDQRAVRDCNYSAFRIEDAENYPDERPRIVLASDGSKQYAALLLTPDFYDKVKIAVEAQREFKNFTQYSMQQVEVVMRFESRIGTEIRHHESRLEDIERGEERDQVKETSLREELEVLREMKEEARGEEKGIWAQLENRAICLRSIQADANAYLEEAFVDAGLLEAQTKRPKIKLEDRDLQTEYQRFRQGLQEFQCDGSFPPLDVSRDHMKVPPMTEEQQAQQDLVDAFWEADERLKKAQRNFDNIGYLKKVDYDANNKAFERGEEVKYITREDFDLYWLKRGQEMTRELLEAEEAFSAVKALASEAGLAIWADSQVSNSIEYNDDEMSGLEDCIAFAPQPGVTNWLTSLSDQLSPSFKGEAPEADEWEAGEVGISDSISVVAAGEEKKRIDRWRKTLSLE